jgi:hypothetical protein
MAEVYEANDGMLGSDRWKRHEQERLDASLPERDVADC